MNEFTKEELKDLEYCLSLARKQDIILPGNEKCDFLLNKIQSMIDNYCEHEDDIVQVKNPKTDRYVKIDRTEGKIISHKQSPGPYKGVPVVRRTKDN